MKTGNCTRAIFRGNRAGPKNCTRAILLTGGSHE
jgi:hypothetical protein